MKDNKKKHKQQRSRRTFLKSMGLVVGGLSVLKPSVFGIGKNLRRERGIHGSDFLLNADLQSDKVLPDGVRAVWDISKAYHETTPTRERVCINGLWQWQPGSPQSDQIPTTEWGYFKVPGNWPGLGNYMQRENQRLYPHPAWKGKSVDNISAAWYQREISIPENWKNRRVIMTIDYVNSAALLFIDGKRAGEVLFPSGELDLTPICTPGNKYIVTIKVTALPLQDVVAVYSDSNAPRLGKGVVARKGLCGDVYLSGTPLKARLNNVKVVTSVRREEITFNIGMEDLSPGSNYNLSAVITDRGNKIAEFKSNAFKRR